MRSSLAFAGIVLAVFLTGAFLSRVSQSNDQTREAGIVGKSPSPHDGLTHFRGSAPGIAPDNSVVYNTQNVFVPNLGQVDSDTYFQLASSRQIAFFRASTIAIHSRLDQGMVGHSGSGIEVRFIGAHQRPQLTATVQSKRRLSFRGRKGNSDYGVSVPLFSEITYRNLYDGIDLSILTSASTTRRQFTISSGTEISEVLMHYDGAGEPALQASGDLKIPFPDGAVRYSQPTAFQEVDGKRIPVEVGYKLGRYGAFGFAVGAYDKSRPLVIEADGV